MFISDANDSIGNSERFELDGSARFGLHLIIFITFYSSNAYRFLLGIYQIWVLNKLISLSPAFATNIHTLTLTNTHSLEWRHEFQDSRVHCERERMNMTFSVRNEQVITNLVSPVINLYS